MEKKQIEVEKRNFDPENLQNTLREHFPLLVGQEISLWMMRKDNPNLVVLPAHVNSGAALCRYEELGRSCIYVKPHVLHINCWYNKNKNIIFIIKMRTQRCNSCQLNEHPIYLTQPGQVFNIILKTHIYFENVTIYRYTKISFMLRYGLSSTLKTLRYTGVSTIYGIC